MEEKTAKIRRKISSFQRFNEYFGACPYHEYSEPLLIRFFYDDLDPYSRANLDAGAGGQLRKFLEAQLEDTIEDVVRNYSWGGKRRIQGRANGKFELDQESLKAFREQLLDKKLGNKQASSSSSR